MPTTTSRRASTPPEPTALSRRYREILADIVRTHIRSGEPVSSRLVSRHSQHQLSSATIRNVMADLEETGLLRQPHTSAGRIPTEAGYRLYVEDLMQPDSISEEEKRYIEERLSSKDADRLMSSATSLLSELSHRVGVVLTPAADEIFVKSADFVSLGGRRVLCVIISSGGFMDHIVVDTEEELSRDELVRISNYVTEHFTGLRLAEIRDQLLQMMAQERARVDCWLAQAITLARQAVRGTTIQEVLVEGTSSLLDQPELSDIENIRRMLDTFADQARLVCLLNQCLSTDGVRVFLGEDSDVTMELDFSLVGTTYGIGEEALGSLGIIGPSRMAYPRMVPLVRFLGETLSKALASASQL